MRTILNVALGLALAFCIVFMVSGEFEKYVDKKVEAAVAAQLGAGVVTVPTAEPTEKATAEVVKQPQKVQKTAQKPVADNRQYIEVRSSKGKAKLYIGQPKAEVLELLGTPDTFDFGGSSERCTYEVGVAEWFVLYFRNGKLTEVNKY